MSSLSTLAMGSAMLVTLQTAVALATPLEMSTVAGTLNDEPVTLEEVDVALGGSITQNWKEMAEIVRISARAICEERAIAKQLSESDLSREEWLAQLWTRAGEEPGDAGAKAETHRLQRITRYRALESSDRRMSLQGQFALRPEATTTLAEVREPALPSVVGTCFGGAITAESVEAFAPYPLYRRRAETVRISCRQFEIDYSNPLVLSRMAIARGVSVDELVAASSKGARRASDAEVRAAAFAQYGNTEPSTLARTRLVLDTVHVTRIRSSFLDEVRQSTTGSCALDLPAAPVLEPSPGRSASTLSGDDDALRIVYFGSFDCEHCPAGWKSLVELRSRWKDRVRIEFRHHFPDAGFTAFDQALEATCSAEQGRAWEYGSWRIATSQTPALEAADELGLAAETFRACLADPRSAARVLSDTQEALRLGLREAIPSFVIGRRPRLGLQSDRILDATIEAELRSLSPASEP